MIVVIILVAGIALAIIVKAIRTHSFRKKMEKNGIETEAEIIKIISTDTVTIVLGYTVDGIYFETKYNTMKAHEAGQKVKLLYQIDNPKAILLAEDTGKRRIFFEIVLVFLGLIALFGLIMIWVQPD